MSIGVVSYGTLGHVPPGLPAIIFFSSLRSHIAILVYNSQLYPISYLNTVKSTKRHCVLNRTSHSLSCWLWDHHWHDSNDFLKLDTKGRFENVSNRLKRHSTTRIANTEIVFGRGSALTPREDSLWRSLRPLVCWGREITFPIVPPRPVGGARNFHLRDIA